MTPETDAAEKPSSEHSEIAQAERLQTRFQQLDSDVADIRRETTVAQSDRLTLDASVKVTKAVLKSSPGISSIELLNMLTITIANDHLPPSLKWGKLALDILLHSTYVSNALPKASTNVKLGEFLGEVYKLPVNSPEFMQTTAKQRQLYLALAEEVRIYCIPSENGTLDAGSIVETKSVFPAPKDDEASKHQRIE